MVDSIAIAAATAASAFTGTEKFPLDVSGANRFGTTRQMADFVGAPVVSQLLVDTTSRKTLTDVTGPGTGSHTCLWHVVFGEIEEQFGTDISVDLDPEGDGSAPSLFTVNTAGLYLIDMITGWENIDPRPDNGWVRSRINVVGAPLTQDFRPIYGSNHDFGDSGPEDMDQRLPTVVRYLTDGQTFSAQVDYSGDTPTIEVRYVELQIVGLIATRAT